MAVEAASHDIQAYMSTDLIVNILSRLPSKCLLRFKSVCKSWYSLITHDTVFRTLHLRKSNPNTNSDSRWLANRPEGTYHCLYGSNFWVYDRKFPYSTKIQPYHVPIEHRLPSRLVSFSRIVGWCDGVVAIMQTLPHLGRLICLWNPSIRKYKRVFLPWNKITNNSRFKPPLTRIRHEPRHLLCGFGLDVYCNEYKFVAVCPENDKEVSQVFVYSLKTGNWTKIDIDLKPLCAKLYLRGRKLHATYVNGACHWIRTDVRRGEEIVLSFNLTRHHIRYIDLPPKSPPCGYGDDYDDSFTLSVWKDMLSVSETTKVGTMNALKIWVIKDDYSNSSSCSWTLIKTVYIKENYWGRNRLTGYCPWGFIKNNSNLSPSPSTPFVDSISDDEADEIQKYLTAPLDELVPFQESLVLP